MFRKTYSIHCVRCNFKIYKYLKLGKGQLIRCWKSRILNDNAIYENDYVKCKCGNIIGINKGLFIQLKQNEIKKT